MNGKATDDSRVDIAESVGVATLQVIDCPAQTRGKHGLRRSDEKVRDRVRTATEVKKPREEREEERSPKKEMKTERAPTTKLKHENTIKNENTKESREMLKETQKELAVAASQNSIPANLGTQKANTDINETKKERKVFTASMSDEIGGKKRRRSPAYEERFAKKACLGEGVVDPKAKQEISEASSSRKFKGNKRNRVEVLDSDEETEESGNKRSKRARKCTNVCSREVHTEKLVDVKQDEEHTADEALEPSHGSLYDDFDPEKNSSGSLYDDFELKTASKGLKTKSKKASVTRRQWNLKNAPRVNTGRVNHKREKRKMKNIKKSSSERKPIRVSWKGRAFVFVFCCVRSMDRFVLVFLLINYVQCSHSRICAVKIASL